MLFDETVKIPRNLPCGHTFCEECLLNIEKKNLLLCPICRDPLQKNLKATKLPKNFIALEISRKHSEIMKNPLCLVHTKEIVKYFCNTCEKLICPECILDHSGHEFVRREESCFVIRDNAMSIKSTIEESCDQANNLIMKGDNALQFLDKK